LQAGLLVSQTSVDRNALILSRLIDSAAQLVPLISACLVCIGIQTGSPF